MNDAIYAGKFPAIIEIQKAQAVNVSSAPFVWDSTQWETDKSAVLDHKSVTGFKLKVSKGCFLKVQHYYDDAPALCYFKQGLNEDLIIKVVNNADNKDEAGDAFAGATAGTIVAGVCGDF